MRRKYNEQLAQAVEKLLSTWAWNVTFNRKRGRFSFVSQPGSCSVYLQGEIYIHDTDLNLYGSFPLRGDAVPPARRQELEKFLHDANRGLRSGNFELERTTGEIRYKCFLDCAGLAAPTEAMLHNALRCIAWMFDRYGIGIRMILHNGMDAAKAMAICEAPTRGFYCVNNEASPAESADAIGIRVPWEALYDELQEGDEDTLQMLRDMRACDRDL